MWRLLLSLTTVGVMLVSTASGQGRRVVVASTTLREFAIVAPTPEYPRSSALAGIQGRVVVSVSYDSKGLPTVSLIEAPDADIGTATREALLRWRFRPFLLDDNSTASQTRGRLVFYFKQKNGNTMVTDAAAVVLASEQSQRSVHR